MERDQVAQPATDAEAADLIVRKLEMLIAKASLLREREGRNPAARHLSIAITHLEDAQLRISAAYPPPQAD